MGPRGRADWRNKPTCLQRECSTWFPASTTRKLLFQYLKQNVQSSLTEVSPNNGARMCRARWLLRLRSRLQEAGSSLDNRLGWLGAGADSGSDGSRQTTKSRCRKSGVCGASVTQYTYSRHQRRQNDGLLPTGRRRNHHRLRHLSNSEASPMCNNRSMTRLYADPVCAEPCFPGWKPGTGQRK
jgi:hypothetical protein